MEVFRYNPEGDEDTLVLTVALLPEQSEQIGKDTERELSFALSALDMADPSTLRWLAACAIMRSLELEKTRERLEYLRSQIHAECISYGELAELQSLAAYIEPGDVELLEWAGVPEFEED